MLLYLRKVSSSLRCVYTKWMAPNFSWPVEILAKYIESFCTVMTALSDLMVVRMIRFLLAFCLNLRMILTRINKSPIWWPVSDLWSLILMQSVSENAHTHDNHMIKTSHFGVWAFGDPCGYSGIFRHAIVDALAFGELAEVHRNTETCHTLQHIEEYHIHPHDLKIRPHDDSQVLLMTHVQRTATL